MKINLALPRRTAALTVLALAAGCGILDVSNPNNVNSTALDNPSAAAAEVSGEVAALARALEQVVGDIEISSDNIQWTGSLDGVNDLNKGNVRNPYNEFTENSMFGPTTTTAACGCSIWSAPRIANACPPRSRMPL